MPSAEGMRNLGAAIENETVDAFDISCIKAQCKKIDVVRAFAHWWLRIDNAERKSFCHLELVSPDVLKDLVRPLVQEAIRDELANLQLTQVSKEDAEQDADEIVAGAEADVAKPHGNRGKIRAAQR